MYLDGGPLVKQLPLKGYPPQISLTIIIIINNNNDDMMYDMTCDMLTY